LALGRVGAGQWQLDGLFRPLPIKPAIDWSPRDQLGSRATPIGSATADLLRYDDVDMTYGVRKSAAIAFLILTVLLAANAFVSYQHLARLVANQERLNQTSETQLALKETLSLIKDLEIGEKGYIITGNEEFLEPYRTAANQLDEQIDKLAESMADDTRDEKIFARLRSLIDDKRTMVVAAIRAHNQQGPDAATAVVAAGEGKAFMDEIRALLGNLEQREQNVLESRWRQSQRSYEAAQLSFALANTAALASVVLVFVLVRRESLENKRTTALIQRSESRFRRLFDANVMGVLFADLNGKVTEANDAFLELIGYSHDDLAAGRVDWRALTPLEFRQQDDHAIEQMRSRGACPPFEKQFIRRDGSLAPVLMGSALLEDPHESCICYVIDLTDRQRARREIETLNALCLQRIQELETLLEVIPIGIAIAPDPDTESITVNAALARLIGLPRDSSATTHLPHDERMQVAGMLDRGRSTAEHNLPRADGDQTLTGVELDLVPRHGSAVKLLQYVAPLLDAQGVLRGSVGAFVDITDRKRLEEQLRQNAEDLHNQQRWLEAVLDLLPMPMLLIDPARGKPTFANKAALEMAEGRFPLEGAAEGQPDAGCCTDLQGNRISPEQMPGARVARGERLSGYELDWHLPSGTRSLLINAGSLPAMYGHEGVSVILFQDITELKQIEGELRRINQAKDTLLAMLGHELRNPLAAITGAAELIRQQESEGPDAEQAQEILERHLRHLARLVDDMLDLSRLSSGKMVLHTEPTELSTILKQAIQTVQSFIESREHRLRLQLPREGVWVNADTSRLEQVFVNLLMNAAKYTDPGGRIALLVEVEDKSVTIRVEDNGIGIAPDMVPRVFDLFAQLNPSIDRSDGGLGVGLNVVKNLVELHAGTVTAESRGVGLGSQFVVQLPRVAAPSQARPATKSKVAAATEQVAARVLVVDDNVDIARVMAALVKRCGHDVRVAHDGLAALTLARSFAPDVALLDIGLPGLSGLDLARRLRVEPGLENLFLVALTGYGQEEDRRRSAEAGFDQHLTKPVSFDILQELLRQALRRSRGSSADRTSRLSHAK
jgi:PAS domain S-box-containing protein